MRAALVVTLAIVLLTMAVVVHTARGLGRRPSLETFSGKTEDLVVLKVHRPDEQALYALSRVLSELLPSTGFRVLLLFDNTRGLWDPKHWLGCDAFVTKDPDLRRLNPLHRDCYWNADSQLVALRRAGRCRGFRWLWLLEYDVYCDGNLARTLRKADHVSADFAATYVERHDPQNAHWVHWDHVEAGAGHAVVPLGSRYKCFAPLIRLTQAALDVLDRSIGKTSGYVEVFVPTAVATAGLSVGNLPHDMFGDFKVYETCRSSEPPRRGDDRLHHKMTWQQGAPPPAPPVSRSP